MAAIRGKTGKVMPGSVAVTNIKKWSFDLTDISIELEEPEENLFNSTKEENNVKQA